MIVINLDVKPLSVNKCWQGRRYKTKAYKQYEAALLHLLPNLDINIHGELKISVEFGFSSKTADIDNPLKPILDILQKKYGFNDREVYELNVKKKIVQKKHEYILIKIDSI
jgi:Holliday junction resolvase RusA-like endonuclease